MSHNLFHNDGIPALARAKDSADLTSFVQCAFNIKYKEHAGLANFSLQCKTHVHPFTEPQPFSLIYDANNLLPTTTKCSATQRTLEEPETTYITRNKPAKTQALSLHLKNPCTILYPAIAGSIAPKPSHESAFTQLVALAKAKEIEILFDGNRLHPNQRSSFVTIVSRPEELSGFPIDGNNLRGRKAGDWTVFSPTEPLVPTDPPSYADASQKRPRDVSSSPPFAPSSKRALYIHQGSPTEKATTIPSSSAPSTVDESLHAPSPQVLLEDTVRNMMQNILPDILAQFLQNSRSISASPPPSETKSPETPVGHRPPYPALRALLGDRVAAKIEQRVDTVCENALYEAHYLRGAADEEFIDGFEEKKLDMQLIIDDLLERVPDDMDNLAKDKLEELEVTATAYIEEALGQMDKRLEQMQSAMNKRLEQMESVMSKSSDTFLSNLSKRTPHGEPHTTEASHQKPNRYGCAAGHRRRHKRRGRIRQQ